MPPLPVTPNCTQVSLRYSLLGSTHIARNVLHFIAEDDVTQAAFDAHIAAISLSWATHFPPFWNNDVVYTGCDAVQLSSNSGLQSVVNGSTVGSGGSSPTPNGTAVVVSLKTQERSRSGRGRVYLPPPALSQLVDPSHITAADAALIVTAMNAFKTDCRALSTPYVLAVLSYFHEGALRPVGRPLDVLSVACNTRLDSQRRRTGR